MVLKLKLSNGFKIYLGFLVVSFISFIISYSYFPVWLKQTNIDNALYLLSSFIQGEAAVLAIVVTLSIVAIQLTASSYSTRAISLLKESLSLWILVLAFIIAIFYSSWVLKFTVSLNNISTNEFQIWIAFLLMIYAFLSLFPYLLEILNFTDPKTIIQLLASKITNNNLISTTKSESYDHPNYRPSGGPLHPLSDVMISALMKYDYGTLKDCLDSIEVSMLKILKNSKFSDTEELDVSNHLFFDHILRVGEIAIDRNDEASVSLILNSLSTIGLKAANLNYSFFSGQSVRAIGQIGEKAAAKNDKSILRESRNYLNCVGERFIDKELKYPIDMVFLYNRTITETALEENIDNARYQDGLTESEIKFNYNILLEALLFIDNIGYKLRQNNKNKIYDLTVELSCIQHLNKKFNQNNERFDWIERMIEESLQKYSN